VLLQQRAVFPAGGGILRGKEGGCYRGEFCGFRGYVRRSFVVGVSGLAVKEFLTRSIDAFIAIFDVGRGVCGVAGEEVCVGVCVGDGGSRGFVVKGAEIRVRIVDADKGVRGIDGGEVRIGDGRRFVVKGKEVSGWVYVVVGGGRGIVVKGGEVRGEVVEKGDRDCILRNRGSMVSGLSAQVEFDFVGKEVRG
jgi:hypothetical protein